MVAYWQNQKWVQGQLQQGGQWYGVAIVLGHVGRNLVLIHRRQVIRCAPEQVRPATNEEKCLISSPDVELLGIKDMIDKGNLHSRQYLDLLPQSYPPQEGDADSREHPAETDPMSEASRLRPPSDEPRLVEQRPADVPMPAVTSSATDPEEPAARETHQSSHPEGNPSERGDVSSSPYPSEPPRESESSGSYGPVRRRVSGKDGAM